MAAKLIDLSFTLNGRKVKVQIAPDTMLFALLREQGCASVRCACETTNCGLCTVWLDGDPVLSCSVPAARVEGRSITTLEGLKAESEALARAMAAEGAEQCGFCAPGLIMNVLALARAAKEDPSLVATREELSRQLAGNLCRCSGYESQLRAIVRFLNESGVQVGFEMPELPVNDTSCDGVTYKQITHKQPKKDSKALLEGRPVYTGDMVPAGALIVKLKRSPYARAKIRSKKKVIQEMLLRMEQYADNGLDYDGKCFISQSECYDDARALADLIEARFPKLNGKVEINYVGTTIGSHTGPGTVALFFWGRDRKLPLL